MRITEHKHRSKISLGCNKHLKRRIVRNQTILFQAAEAKMVLHAKLQKKILKYSMITFEQSMLENHNLTKLFLMTYRNAQHLKDVTIYQLTRKL